MGSERGRAVCRGEGWGDGLTVGLGQMLTHLILAARWGMGEPLPPAPSRATGVLAAPGTRGKGSSSWLGPPG